MIEWLWKIAELVVPATEAQWIAAMRAEAPFSPGGPERVQWLAGALTSAVRLRAAAHDADVAAGLLIGAMLAIDWTRGDAAPAILLIAASAIALVWRKPRQTIRATLIAGGALPLAHAVANFNPALWPYYQCKRLDGLDWAILTALFVPAYLAAQAGRCWAERPRSS
ncbi:MAG: hypothetical protein ABR588_04835 [Sphingomicrobium sp.]|nr:hypothetical protein [Sphingomonadales bacterium]